jgi:hypothetical protein
MAEDLGEDDPFLDLDVEHWSLEDECDDEGDGELGQNCLAESEQDHEPERGGSGSQARGGRGSKPERDPDAERGSGAERDSNADRGRAERESEHDCRDCQDRCAEPDTGCSCLPGTAPIPCQLPRGAMRADSILCEDGERYCRDGRWTRCIGIAAFE